MSNSTSKAYAFLVFYLVLLSALGSFVNDMFTPAMPAMRRVFDCTVPTMQMGLTAGMIGLGLGQILLGPISDKYGRKPVLAFSIALFIVAAIVSVFSPSVHFFIWCRLFQGLGVSGAYFLARTIPADLYSGRPLAKIMALIGAINGFAPASAPVLGGVMSDSWGWRSIFIALAVMASIILLLAPKMPESLPRAHRNTGSLWQSFGGFKVLLRNKPFMLHSAFKGVSLGLLFAYISAAPFILQDIYHFSQTTYGLIIGANAVFVAFGAMMALKFKELKTAAHYATFIVVIAVAAQAFVLWHVHDFWGFEACIIPMLIGMGMIFTSSNTLAMNEGREHAGEASAILGVAGYAVGAVVSPLVGVGNILHSTAIVYVALAAVILLLNIFTFRLPADLD